MAAVAQPVSRRRPARSTRRTTNARDWVAIILAVGISTSVNFITLAVFYDAVINEGSELSENATQLLTAAFGGVIGILGSFLGFRAGLAQQEKQPDPPATEPPTTTP